MSDSSSLDLAMPQPFEGRRSPRADVDHALVTRIDSTDGELDALAELYDQYAPRVYALLLHGSGDEEVASRRLRELFENVSSRALRLHGDRPVLPQLLVAARQLIGEGVPWAPSVAAGSDGPLSRLSREDRDLLSALYPGGHTLDDVARKTGVPREEIRARAVASMQRLRSVLHPEEKGSL